MKSSTSTANSTSNSKKAKSPKKKKQTDPNKPRRALNTYNIFFAIQQQKLLLRQRTAHGSLKKHVKGGFDDLAWTVSERWRKLDVAYKTKLENLASMDKDRHDREMKAWKVMKNLNGQDLTKSRDWRVKRRMANELTARIKEIAQQEASEEFIEIHGNPHNDFPTHQQSEQDLMLANLLIHLSENPYGFTECQQNKQESQYCELETAAKIAGDGMVMAAVNLRFRYGPSENVTEAGDNSSKCKQNKQDPILLKGSNKDEMKSPSEQDAAATRVTPTLECCDAQIAGDAMTAILTRIRCDPNHNSLEEPKLATVCGPSENAAKTHQMQAQPFAINKNTEKAFTLAEEARARGQDWNSCLWAATEV